MPKFTLPDSLKRDLKQENKEEKIQHIGIIDGNNHNSLIHALIIAEVVHRLNFGLPACGIDPRKPETFKLENVKNPNSIPIERLLKTAKQKKNKKSGPPS